MSATKKCAFCNEDINADALKCRFCGEFVDKEFEALRNDVKEIKDNTPKRFRPFSSQNMGVKWLNAALMVWGFAFVVASVEAFGFALFFVLLLIFGAILLIVCPCIGAGVIGSTAAVWAFLLLIAFTTLVYAASIASVIGLTSPLALLGRNDQNGKVAIIVNFGIHLLVAYWLYDTGLYKVVFSFDAVRPEQIPASVRNLFSK